MKTTLVALALLITTAPLSHLHAAEPSTTPSQTPVQQHVMLSIDFTDAALEEVASMIAKQARSINVIVNKDVAGLRVRNFVVNNISVEEALRAVARAVDVEFQKLNDSTFLLKKMAPEPAASTPAPPVFSVATKPYKLEFTIGNLLTQSIMVDERDTFSIAARVGQHSYKITGINELTKPNMMITMKLERTSSDPKGGVDTSTFITNMKLPVAELSESPSKATEVGRIDVNKQVHLVAVSVTKDK